ncbi:hypothetical protein GWI33_012938 [Rhynchophorus ferrugineus]|uniref:RRM domain-containing protein n=1 Tax=Rhynchophorus ferrugineus TaxID=354439 RepID=A0A834MAG6_RHYFE|nr:hypothetical protein GWI33_012938 [Rhynchophorus ferrugineus]
MADRLFREDTAIYVRYLHISVDNARLEREFSRFGRIVSARVVTDSGRSKGYGFVTFTSREAADTAIKEMNGYKLEGKRLYVSYADRQKPPMEMGQFFPAGLSRGYYDPKLNHPQFFTRNSAESETLTPIEVIERKLAERRIIQQRRVDPSQQLEREQAIQRLSQNMSTIPRLRFPQEDHVARTVPPPQPRQSVTLGQLHHLSDRQTEINHPEEPMPLQFPVPPPPQVIPQAQPFLLTQPTIPRIIFPQQGNQQQILYDHQYHFPHQQLLYPQNPPAFQQPTPAPPPPPPHGQFAAPPYFTSPYEGPSRMFFMGPAFPSPWTVPLPQTHLPTVPTFNVEMPVVPDVPVNPVIPNVPISVRAPASTISSFPSTSASTALRFPTSTSDLPSTSGTPTPAPAAPPIRPSTYAQVCASTHAQTTAPTNSCSVSIPADVKPIPRNKLPVMSFTEEDLNTTPYYMRQLMLREHLYPVVQLMYPYIAKRIINDILDLPNHEIVHMFQHEACLYKRIAEAADSYRQQQIERAALITAAARESNP